MIKSIPLAAIVVRENWNIRGKNEFKKKKLESLMQSIATIGLQHPLILNQNKELVSGHRRFFALQALGETECLCRIVNFDDLNFERLVHIDENLESNSLSTKELEKALSERKEIYFKIKEEEEQERKRLEELNAKAEEEEEQKKPKKQKKPKEPKTKNFNKETAEKLGVSETKVKRLVKRVDDVTEEVREAYENEEITSSQVDEIVKLPKKDQNAILEKIKGASVAETQFIVSGKLNKETKDFKETQFLKDLMKDLKTVGQKIDDLMANEYYKVVDDVTREKFIDIFNDTYEKFGVFVEASTDDNDNSQYIDMEGDFNDSDLYNA